MSDSNVPTALPVQSEFPRKVVLLFLLIIDTAIGIFFLFRHWPETNFLVRDIFADLSVGLVAGFAARILFRKRGWFIRFITATASMIVGLVLVGFLTKWRTGIGPLSFSRNTIDWASLAQIIFGLISMLLAMQAWSKPAQVNAAALPVVPAAVPPVSPKAQPRPKRKRKRTKPATTARSLARGQVRENAPIEPVRIPLPALSVRPASASEPAKPIIKRKRSAKTDLKTAPSFALHRPKVRLSKVENHLCPYCLEPVIRKDPRGIVECEICHTLHHGDCWSIAGSCQVPHFTA